MKGQLSAEMLILLALVVALVVIAYSYMTGMVGKVGSTMNQTATSAVAENNPYYCNSDSDCAKFTNLKTCVQNVCSPQGT